MKKIKKNAGSALVLPIEGEMTIYRAAQLKQSLLDALEKNKALDIDLSRVSEIDSSGIQLLLAAARQARSKNKALRFRQHSAGVAQLIELMGLSSQLGVPSVEHSLQS